MGKKNDFAGLPFERLSSRYSSRKYPLHALTVLSGHSNETSTDYYNDGKSSTLSTYAVWQYTVSGRGQITVNTKNAKKSSDLLPGSMMIVSVPGPQVYCLPADSDHWEHVFLVMIGREAIRMTKMIEKQIGNVIPPDLMKAKPHTSDVLYRMLNELFSGKINDPFANSAYTYGLCMSFMEETGGGIDAKDKQSFLELTDFLKQNLYRDISVEEMASFAGYSRSHFTRAFSNQMGISPRLYLEDLRLKLAIGILYDDRASIKEAAEKSGFYDVNYFCRVFKKRYGISPGKYREINI
jgi:AraC-like DNA-binding protein